MLCYVLAQLGNGLPTCRHRGCVTVLALSGDGGVFMTSGKATLLTIGIAGALAIGIGLAIANHRESTTPDSATVANAPSARIATEGSTKPAPARRADAVTPVAMRPVPPKSPELEHRLKPLLTRGTNMDSAANGFKDWRDFATIAHASRSLTLSPNGASGRSD